MTYHNRGEPSSRRQMQTCITPILEIWVAQVRWVVPENALHQRQVIEENGAAQPPRYVNPVLCISNSTQQAVEQIILHSVGSEA